MRTIDADKLLKVLDKCRRQYDLNNPQTQPTPISFNDLRFCVQESAIGERPNLTVEELENLCCDNWAEREKARKNANKAEAPEALNELINIAAAARKLDKVIVEHQAQGGTETWQAALFAAVGSLRSALGKTPFKGDRPTLSELEKILESEQRVITVQSDGSITTEPAKESVEPSERARALAQKIFGALYKLPSFMEYYGHLTLDQRVQFQDDLPKMIAAAPLLRTEAAATVLRSRILEAFKGPTHLHNAWVNLSKTDRECVLANILNLLMKA